MNLLVSGLIGYALKEVVVPLVNDHFDDKKTEEKQVPEKEVENALFESNDLIKMVSNIIDIVV
ncbi:MULTISPECIES: flagellar hook protein [unclassified Photobacterium]|uniref:flagellar hook protein n=1 Tax=unclassified Photobacterium TaxID=2628852 RepID=UPI000D1793CC|nr:MULTISPECIES: flagellar hook protein [unclassified Photobacterium]PSV28747.1 flagellar hook protein [Photobacterium sp. GB-56]PSV33403.1 flagellar hook protein [Photobacterium sp. GB-72]PSV39336.1 flagellar hook protein [Photobacterium sp. GB-27]PSV40638.1 flagellar hook protein [Photobacterium sp. GB-210]PSV46561.1 flagellar hook protein [Photobacterium sp. GB-36]